MKAIFGVLALSCLLLGFHSGAQALSSWDGHYQVTSTITPLGTNHYLFAYDVENLDQTPNSSTSGLDSFFVQVPLTATVSNITDPPPYINEGGASWIHYLPAPNNPNVPPESGSQWLQWFGSHWPSVYLMGTTAHFSFEASGVGVGMNQGVAVTYPGLEGGSTTFLAGNVSGPSAVPIPGALALLGPGLLGLAVFGRRRIFKK